MKDLMAIMIVVWAVLLVVGFALTLTNLIELASINWLRGGIALLVVGIPTLFSLIDGFKNK